MTFQYPVIKDKIDKKIFIPNEDTFLTGFKAKPTA